MSAFYEYSRVRDQRNRLLELAKRAIDVCQRHIIPDGISAAEAMNEIIGIFDGPEQRAAFSVHGKHIHRASYVNGKLTDECADCGRNFRDELHFRQYESTTEVGNG